MMTNPALLAAIIAAPDDDRPRWIYADWLEQHGQFDQARLMRVQLELARLPDTADAVPALQREEEQLEAACERALPPCEGLQWGSFERGLIHTVYAATPADFQRHASVIAQLGSILHLRLDRLDDFALLAEVPLFAQFTELSVRDDDQWGLRQGNPNHPFNDNLVTVLTSPHCPRLRVLDLNTCQLGPRGASALANCARLESLLHLDLLDNYLGDAGIAALAASPYLSALRYLRIDLNDIGPAGVAALAASATLGHLEELFIGDAIGPAIGLSLAQSPYFTRLHSLSIHDEIGPVGAAALAQAPNLAQLTYLDLRCATGTEAARALAASPYLRQLKTLLLHACWIGDEGAQALAQSPILAHVEYLDLSANQLTDVAAQALAASPYLTRLQPGRLILGTTNPLTEAGWQILRSRFGDALADP